MPHIHTNPGEHDFTASAFIIRLDMPEPSLMMHLHKKLGVLLQFGGHIEIRETPWGTIAHEGKEESGYELSQLMVYQPIDRIKHMTGVVLHPVPLAMNTHPFGLGLDHYHTDIAYALSTTEEPCHAVAAGESNAISLHTLDDLRNIPKEQVFPNVREIGIFILENVVGNWERVPASEFAA